MQPGTHLRAWLCVVTEDLLWVLLVQEYLGGTLEEENMPDILHAHQHQGGSSVCLDHLWFATDFPVLVQAFPCQNFQ